MAALAFKTLGGDGADLVLIHGFGSDRLSWAGNVAALLPVARVHTLDLPGHGDSPPDVGDGSVRELTVRVAQTLKAQGITAAHLLGHSLGGAIAMELAASAPLKVLSLSLIAPAGLGAGIDHEFITRYPELETPGDTAALLGRLVTKPLLISKMTVQHVLARLNQPGARDALRHIASALLTSEALLAASAAALANAATPRIVIWGGSDAINPPYQERLTAFGGLSLIVPEAGHLPHVEGARLVNMALAEFLAGISHD